MLTPDPRLQFLQVIAEAVRPLGRRAAFYLAAAVSDFFVPWADMVRALSRISLKFAQDLSFQNLAVVVRLQCQVSSCLGPKRWMLVSLMFGNNTAVVRLAIQNERQHETALAQS